MPSRRQRSAAAEKARQKVLAESLIRLSGGVESLTLTHALLGDDGAKRLTDALLANHTVRWLHLDDNRIGNAGASALAEVLAGNTGLRVLDLDFNVIQDDGAGALAAALLTNRSLQELDLHFNSIGSAGAVSLAEALETNRSLQSISLHGNAIGDVGAGRLAQALQKNAALRVLHLGEAAIGNDGASQLAEALETNRVLSELHLENNQIGDAGAISLARVVLSNPVLAELWLLQNEIGAAGAWELSKCLRKPGNLRKLGLTINQVNDSEKADILTDLTKRHVLRRAAKHLSGGAACLDLDNQKLGDDGVEELIDDIRSNSNLKELNLKKNGISDAGVEQLAQALSTCANMEKISLAGNDIGDAGASKIALVLDMPHTKVVHLDTLAPKISKVRELDLEHNLIGDVGAMKLAEALEKNDTLERLSLNGNVISDVAITRLELARENSCSLRELTLEEQLEPSEIALSRKSTPDNFKVLDPNEQEPAGYIIELTKEKFGIGDLRLEGNVVGSNLAGLKGPSVSLHNEWLPDVLEHHEGDGEESPDGGLSPSQSAALSSFPSLPDDGASGVESIKPAGHCHMVSTTVKEGLLSMSPPPSMPDHSLPDPFSLEDQDDHRSGIVSIPTTGQPDMGFFHPAPPLPSLQDHAARDAEAGLSAGRCDGGLTTASSTFNERPIESADEADEDVCSADGLQCGHYQESNLRMGDHMPNLDEVPNLDQVSESVQLPQSSEAPFAFGVWSPAFHAVGDDDSHWQEAVDISIPKTMSL